MMPYPKIRIAIITNIITTYRQGFYDRLFARKHIFVKVYCQDNIPGRNLISIHERYPDNVSIVKFYSAKKEKIVWLFIPWKEIINGFDDETTGLYRTLKNLLSLPREELVSKGRAAQEFICKNKNGKVQSAKVLDLFSTFG